MCNPCVALVDFYIFSFNLCGIAFALNSYLFNFQSLFVVSHSWPDISSHLSLTVISSSCTRCSISTNPFPFIFNRSYLSAAFYSPTLVRGLCFRSLLITLPSSVCKCYFSLVLFYSLFSIGRLAFFIVLLGRSTPEFWVLRSDGFSRLLNSFSCIILVANCASLPLLHCLLVAPRF